MRVYLDNCATTRPFDAVISEMARFMRDEYFNPSALYGPALGVERAITAAREALLASLSLRPDSAEVVFTSGGTESVNLAILGFAGALRGKGRFLSCVVEHPSALAALESLIAQGHTVDLLPVTHEGLIAPEELRAALYDKPDMLSLMQVNNETGAVLFQPWVVDMVREISPDTVFHVDAAQGFMRVPLDTRSIDMVSVSGHKLHGPKGIGALIARKGLKLRPMMLGGGQQGARRSGTENTPGIAGLRAAIGEMARVCDAVSLMDNKRFFYEAIVERAPGAALNGPEGNLAAPHILNISFPGVGGEVMLHALEGEGIYVSTGAACSSKKRQMSPVLRAMGIAPELAGSAIRFSISPLTTREELDRAARVAGEQYEKLRVYRRR